MIENSRGPVAATSRSAGPAEKTFTTRCAAASMRFTLWSSAEVTAMREQSGE